MSLSIKHNYVEHLQDAKPTIYHIHQKTGVMMDIQSSETQPITIPPINTNILFDTLPRFTVTDTKGLADISASIPKQFNWRENAGVKQNLITTPGNQMLCGSCWAIASAGIISDNLVVGSVIDWFPDLSTTWILSCNRQNQCQGGNPADALSWVSNNMILSNHCIDYSWCAENEKCNGKATQHFDKNFNLSQLIPQQCGCYYSGKDFYAYTLDKNIQHAIITPQESKSEKITDSIKNHILQWGPVLGGFIVFKNFMKGNFTKLKETGGVYLENGDYDTYPGKVKFNDNMSSSQNYKGSHAVAIIGWGVAKNIIYDNKGNKKDIPYWYCRNSWTTKWGDGGYFKIAMYPHNKIAQFDAVVRLKTSQGIVNPGGIVMVKANKKPKLHKFAGINQNLNFHKKIHSNDYYQKDFKGTNPNYTKQVNNDDNKIKNSDNHSGKKVPKIFGIMLLLVGFFGFFIFKKVSTIIMYGVLIISIAIFLIKK
jgi:hypothetical protein